MGGVGDLSGNAPLTYAADCGQIGVIGLLIGQRADIATTTNKGNQHLHQAAISGHLNVVKILVTLRAEIAAEGHRRLIPLQLATQNRRAAVVEFLSSSHELKPFRIQASNKLTFGREGTL